MKVIIVVFCLIGAVCAKPISQSVVSPSSNFNSNSTESVSTSQSAESNTSENESSEEATSIPHSESQSLETTEDRTTEESQSKSDEDDTTSEESNSQSDEVEERDSRDETKDDSMSSEENVRKRWLQVFESVLKILRIGKDSSTGFKALYELQGRDSDSSSITRESTSSELNDCVNGTQSCESEEFFFQSIGDDPQYSLHGLLVPDEDEKDFSF
ncbi:secretory calcium-binding phosphoprotein 1 [Gouania willdenowi]|uniref:secretory calcium-binding phosphoprotein 1 n=1 Tax=Gouania willdenowi TaxID=441366 RepID=UPI001054A785|nr:osteopontin-like [Gouania willdenowi]